MRHAQLTTVYVGERQLSIGIGETRGKRDRVTTVGPAVHSHEHVLNITGLLVGVDNNLDRDRPSTIR